MRSVSVVVVVMMVVSCGPGLGHQVLGVADDDDLPAHPQHLDGGGVQVGHDLGGEHLVRGADAVATVDQNGVIYPVDGGSCNITAIANDGYGAKCVVTVHVEPDIPLEMTGVDVHYTATGMPLVTPEVRNCSFDTDIVGFTFAVRCSDAYGNALALKDGDGSFAWKEAVLSPGQKWEDAAWGGSLAGCEMVWKVEAWLTEVTTANGDVVTVPEEERTVFSWEKY